MNGSNAPAILIAGPRQEAHARIATAAPYSKKQAVLAGVMITLLLGMLAVALLFAFFPAEMVPAILFQSAGLLMCLGLIGHSISGFAVASTLLFMPVLLPLVIFHAVKGNQDL